MSNFDKYPPRLSEKSAAALLGVTVRTLRSWRASGKGPPHVRIGRKRVMYDEAVLHAWIGQRAAKGAVRCPTCGGWRSPPTDEPGGGKDHA